MQNTAAQLSNNSQLTARRLAYREFGDPYGEVVLICVPGILETQSSFNQLINYIEQHDGCRLITVDLCGRGSSDWLEDSNMYRMSLYIEDLKKLITHLHTTHKRKSRKLYLLGTSMGGILTMQLASDKLLRIKGLILNDVALTISWKSLYALYSKFDSAMSQNEIHQFSATNTIDPKLINEVKLPRHVDIDYRVNLRGIHFHKSLSNFDGPILLLRGENSQLCSLLDQIEFTLYAKQGRAVEIHDEGHPVSFTPEVLLEISKFLNLKKVSDSFCSEAFDLDYQTLDRYKKLSMT